LPGDRFQQLALVPEGDPVFPRGLSSRLKEGLFKSGGLLPHGVQRLPNHRWAYAHGAKIADFLNFEQIGKRVGLGGIDQPSSLPIGQLTWAEVENPD